MALTLAPTRNGQRPDSPSRSRKVSPGRIAAWTYLAVVMTVTLFPFYWILRTALSNNYLLSTDPSSPLPVGFTWGAFERALGIASAAEAQAQGGSGASLDIALFLRNSLVYAITQTFLIVLFSAAGAYAFARLHWRGRDLVFNILITALMVPTVFTLLPNFVMIKDLGLLNSFAGLILPGGSSRRSRCSSCGSSCSGSAARSRKPRSSTAPGHCGSSSGSSCPCRPHRSRPSHC